jgi:hypothetical protein
VRLSVSPTPLVDLRVVEISDRIAGAYCGKLFVDGCRRRKVGRSQEIVAPLDRSGCRAAGAPMPLIRYSIPGSEA